MRTRLARGPFAGDEERGERAGLADGDRRQRPAVLGKMRLPGAPHRGGERAREQQPPEQGIGGSAAASVPARAARRAGELAAARGRDPGHEQDLARDDEQPRWSPW